MKILHLGKYYFPIKGGIETYYYELSNDFVKKRNQVSVIVSNITRKREISNVKGVIVLRMENYMKRLLNAPVTFPFVHLIGLFKPDIIHLHCPNPWAEFNLFLYKLLGGKGKVIVTYHSDVIHYSILHTVLDFLRKIYLYPLLKLFTSKIIATSPNYVEGSNVLNTVRDKIVVIPLFINTEAYKPDHQQSDKFVLLFEGRLVKYKGLEYLVQAIKNVATIRTDFVLYIVGGGKLEDKLKKMVKDLGLSNLVKFTGLVSDELRTRYYKKADLFILPSIYKSEAFSFSQLEAMAFGIPVISCNIAGSGVPYANKNHVTGIVVRPEDSRELSKAIIQLLIDSKMRATYGKNARERVLKLFSQKNVITQIENLYKSV